jgi:hypothetical protein
MSIKRHKKATIPPSTDSPFPFVARAVGVGEKVDSPEDIGAAVTVALDVCLS